MEKKILRDKEKDEYLIENRGKLPDEIIAEHLGISKGAVRKRAYILRSRGIPVFKYPSINWKNPERRELLAESFGGMPTHKLADILKATPSVILHQAKKLSISFKGNAGKYTFSELAQLLKLAPNTVRSWAKLGLKISGYAKDGLTGPWKKMAKAERKPRYFHALIDLDDLKRFLKKRPEAYDLNKLDEEAKFVLELHKLKNKWKEKMVYCKNCQRYFWTELYNQISDRNQNVRCPKCKTFVSKWAKEYQ